jgi:DNA-binding XRE family transcriptional regulator
VRQNEDIADITAFDAAISRQEESFPLALFDAIDAGRNVILVFREYRHITQQELAKASAISVPYLCQLETGARKGSIKSLKAIAGALGITMDLLA